MSVGLQVFWLGIHSVYVSSVVDVFVISVALSVLLHLLLLLLSSPPPRSCCCRLLPATVSAAAVFALLAVVTSNFGS